MSCIPILELDKEWDKLTRPSCSHGPAILFERCSEKGKTSRFFSCSAFRDRKDCPLYVKFEDWIKQNPSKILHYTTENLCLIRDTKISSRSVADLKSNSNFCSFCCEFISNSDHPHETISVDMKTLDFSTLLPPSDHDKGLAQYIFDSQTLKLIETSILDREYSHFLCIGTPSLHQLLLKKQKNSLLLDLDALFFPNSFCLFNMINGHFFDSLEIFKQFLSSQQKVAILIDPPFGALISLVSHVLSSLRTQILHSEVFWFFPYFEEAKILDFNPSFSMLDLKVGYSNHSNFGKKTDRGSPIRIFTDVSPAEIVLPRPDYYFCAICKRYSALENLHCVLCNQCCSKNGQTYIHCKQCRKCVKPNRVHCKKCKACLPQEHNCNQVSRTMKGPVCHNCGQIGHKKYQCPQFLKKTKLEKL